jgi:two-component system chemotaxis response regulator CheY
MVKTKTTNNTKKILVVEDEKPLREAFCYLLESEGFTVVPAENGQLGLQKLKGFSPDIILLDMIMPVLDGMGFLQQAKLVRDHPRTRTLLLSNLSDAITFDDAHTFGVTRSVLKADLSPVQLVDAVKKMLSESD